MKKIIISAFVFAASFGFLNSCEQAQATCKPACAPAAMSCEQKDCKCDSSCCEQKDGKCAMPCANKECCGQGCTSAPEQAAPAESK